MFTPLNGSFKIKSRNPNLALGLPYKALANFCAAIFFLATVISPMSSFGNDQSDSDSCEHILEATKPVHNANVKPLNGNQTIPMATAALPINAESIVKANALSPWLPSARDSHILDITQRQGTLLEALSGYYQNASNMGVQTYSNQSIAAEDTVIFDSISSEIANTNNNDLNTFVTLLQKARQNLKKGGRVIVYDYVRPLESERLVLLKLRQKKILPKRMFGEFYKNFSDKGIKLRESHWDGDSIYFTDLATAHEYLLRLATVFNDDFEQSAILAPWTKTQLETALDMAGLKLIHSEAFISAWNVERFYKNAVQISNPATGSVIPYPNQRILLVAEIASE